MNQKRDGHPHYLRPNDGDLGNDKDIDNFNTVGDFDAAI